MFHLGLSASQNTSICHHKQLLGLPVKFENTLGLHLKPLMLQQKESPPQAWGRAQPMSVSEGALAPALCTSGKLPIPSTCPETGI